MIFDKITKSYYRLTKPDFWASYQYQKLVRTMQKDDIVKIQFDRLIRLLTFAYNHSRFYNQYFQENGKKPSDIKGIQDYINLPILNKAILRDKADEILIRNRYSYIDDCTSGSTGEPFHFFIDCINEAPKSLAAFFLNKEAMGINPFRSIKTLTLKALPKNCINIENIDKLIISSFQKIKGNFLGTAYGISVNDLSLENICKIIPLFKRLQINSLYGYSQSIVKLIDLFKDQNFTPKIDYVITIGEALLEWQRVKIESFLNCNVFMDYGSSECMRIAFECSEKNMHLDFYRYFINLVDDNGMPVSNGEEGRVIVTNLNNYVFPFINYDIGDKMIISDKNCPCGLHFPVVKEIRGRNLDFIITKSGQQLTSTVFVNFFKNHHEQIKRCQLTQTSMNNLRLDIVPAKNIDKPLLETINNEISKITKNEIEHEIRIVKEIKPDRSGKIRIIVPLKRS